MEYIKRTRSLENYTIRDVDESLLVDNGHDGLSANTTNYTFYKHNFSTSYNNGVYTNSVNTIVPDTTSDGILYGKVLDYKTDRKGNPIRDNAGKLIPNTIDIDIFLKQTFDDMGMFTDMDFVPFQNGSPLSTNQFLSNEYRQSLSDPNFTKPNPFNPFIDGRHPLITETEYEQDSITVNGETDDRKLLSVNSYTFVSGLPYKENLNMSNNMHTTFDGVIKVNNTTDPKYVEYVIGGSVNSANNHQTDGNDQLVSGTGIIFKTYFNEYEEKVNKDGKVDRWKKTEFRHNAGGRNVDTNMILKALIKEEEFSGIVFPPEVENNVFIIRGGEDIFERHAIMSEIKTSSDIDDYRDDYF